MRGHHRHLSEMPLEFSLEFRNQAAHERLVNISSGGLAFSTRIGVRPGAPIHIKIPLGSHLFDVDGRVVWCNKTDHRYEVGVRFDDPQSEYRAQMIDQLCHIERYRWIAYLGLAVILYVAATMIYEGFVDRHVGVMTLF